MSHFAVYRAARARVCGVRFGGWLVVGLLCRLPRLTVEVGLNANTSFIRAATRGSYVELTRRWATNDTVTVQLPMALEGSEYAGVNQVAGARRFAYLYGPTLLAAVPDPALLPALLPTLLPTLWNTTTDCLEIKGVDPTAPQTWLTQPDAEELRFTSRDVPGVAFVPYFQVQDELFTVYPCFRL